MSEMNRPATRGEVAQLLSKEPLTLSNGVDNPYRRYGSALICRYSSVAPLDLTAISLQLALESLQFFFDEILPLAKLATPLLDR